MALGLTQSLKGLTTLSPSCADCLEILEPQPPGTLRACNGIALPFFMCYSKMKFIYRKHRYGFTKMYKIQKNLIFKSHLRTRVKYESVL
jgi:hypothetical protein